MTYDLPPRRELPPEARDRIRLRFRAGLDQPERHHRRPVWLAAAAVVLLAAGAVFATGVLRDDSSGPSPAPPAGGAQLDLGLAAKSLDRCWAAAKSGGAVVADRRDWTPLFTVKHGDAVVVAVMAGDRPLFCEATLTSVTVSNPAAAPVPVPGTKAELLLRTTDGLIAGLADPEWPGVRATAREANLLPSGINTTGLSPLSRQFAAFTDAGPAVPLAIGPSNTEQLADLPAAPAPLATVVDRPAPAERTSEAGRFLGQCLAGAQQQVPDRDAYVAGAYLSWNGRKLVVARLGQRVLVCSARPDPGQAGAVYYGLNPEVSPGELKPGDGVATLLPVLAPVKDTGTPEQLVVAAAVPENVTKMSVTFPGGQPKDAVVAHGTFAVWYSDADDSSTVVDARTTVKAYDAAGSLVLQSSLKLF
ncbi:hypothetical protein OG943_41695 [Amycolatopsis sp. NBC_00345]|uniref:hypothetical protein n=1 Tax=Amycolatopsis sp. NBC_00345 TaxID=2975955 RepID=UPI002E2722BF